MSSPSPQTPHAEASASDADAERQAKSLKRQREAIGLSDPHSSTEAQEPKRKKLSAVSSNEVLQTTSSSLNHQAQRDLLERLNRRRLEGTRINFTASRTSTQATKGAYGEVAIATLILDDDTYSESENQVAVKNFTLSDNIDGEKFLRTFANELQVLDGLDHPNIIKLVGFVEDLGNRIAWLVFPWEANGNVREFLRSGEWELPERVSLIKDVASGLKYLHSREPPVRHGDLKSLNILVNSDQRAIITDFGSARIRSEARGFETTGGSPRHQAASTHSEVTCHDGCPEVTVSASNAELTLTGPSWSFRWAAPEVLTEEQPCLASDIWALGWIAWEIVTDNYPFPEANTVAIITAYVFTRRLPHLYDDDQLSQLGDLCHMMVRCWKAEPEQRPSAADCQRDLSWIPSSIPRTLSDGMSQIRSAALLLKMGELHYFKNRLTDALKFYRDGFAAAESASDKGTMARALQMAAESHRFLHEFDKAMECCNQSLAISANIGWDIGQMDALRVLGEIHEARFNYAKAGESFNQSLAMSRSLGWSHGQANALEALGQIYRTQYNDTKAEESFSQSLAIFTSLGDGLGQANALKGLGEIHQARSNYAKAEESFNQALVIYRGLGRVLGQANALKRLGEIHQARSNYAEAEGSFNQALTIYMDMKDSLGQANALRRLGEIHQAIANYAEAEESFNQALVIYRGLGIRLGQADALRGLGEIHLAISNYAEAEESFNHALAIYMDIKDSLGHTNSLLGLAEVLLRQARYSEAKPLLGEAAQIANQIDYEWAQEYSKKLLVEVLDAEELST